MPYNTHIQYFNLVLFILVVMTANTSYAITVTPSYGSNPKVDEAYTLSGDTSGLIVKNTWQEICEYIGERITEIPNGVFCVNSNGNAYYPQRGDICADGSFRVPAWGTSCDDEQPYCPDSSWVLSENKKSCYLPDELCEPDIDSVSEETLLAAITYGEASVNSTYEEIAGIASAIIRSRNARHLDTVNDLIKKIPHFSKVISNGNIRYKQVMCTANDSWFLTAYEAARNALNGGKDFSNGGCFWDGIDLKSQGENHYRYLYGFTYTKASHDIFGAHEPPKKLKHSVNGTYNIVFDSTAAHGKTIFWKYNNNYLKATRGRQCI